MTQRPHDDILSHIADLARERFGWHGDMNAETRLVEDLGLDSLKLMEMAITIENHFRIRIDEASEAEIVTVGDLVAIIERASGSRPGSEK